MQREIEKASPQLVGHDAEIWMKFIKRDVPKWEDKPHEPSNPESWFKVYRKLLADSANEIDDDAKALEATLKGIKAEQSKHTIRQVRQSTVPKLPKMGGMIYATSLPQWKREKAMRKPPPPPPPSALNFNAGSRTKTLTGAGVINKARREAQQQSLFSHKKSKLVTPTHELSSKARGVQFAPKGIVADYINPVASKPVDPTVKQPTIFVPKRKIVRDPPTSDGMTVEERERRLKAFTNPTSVGNSSSAKPQEPSSTSPAIPTERSEAGVLPSTELIPPADSLHHNMSAMSAQNTNASYPNPSYRVPKIKSLSPETKGQKPLIKKRAPVDPFMPAKRRRVA